MRGFSVYVAVALGVGIGVSLAGIVDKTKETLKLEDGRYQLHASASGSQQPVEDLECPIPVNLVPNTGSFRVVLDNEDFADPQFAIIVTAKGNSSPSAMFMMVNGNARELRLSPARMDLFEEWYFMDSRVNIAGFHGQATARPDIQIHIEDNLNLKVPVTPAKGTIRYFPSQTHHWQEKYLQITINADEDANEDEPPKTRLKISCLSDTPRSMNAGSIDAGQNYVMYRSRILYANTENAQDEGPYLMKPVYGESYYQLRLLRAGRQNQPLARRGMGAVDSITGLVIDY